VSTKEIIYETQTSDYPPTLYNWQPFIALCWSSVPAYISGERKYVGPSKRNLILRINEHQPSATHQTESEVTQQLLENPQHMINFKDPKILAKENQWRNKETLLFIQKVQPALNNDERSNPLYLFNV